MITSLPRRPVSRSLPRTPAKGSSCTCAANTVRSCSPAWTCCARPAASATVTEAASGHPSSSAASHTTASAATVPRAGRRCRSTTPASRTPASAGSTTTAARATPAPTTAAAVPSPPTWVWTNSTALPRKGASNTGSNGRARTAVKPASAIRPTARSPASAAPTPTAIRAARRGSTRTIATPARTSRGIRRNAVGVMAVNVFGSTRTPRTTSAATTSTSRRRRDDRRDPAGTLSTPYLTLSEGRSFMPRAPLPCGTMRGLLVAGTTSDAGKSVVTAGICRWLARQGLRVAPFKAQNMSLNSAVVPDGAGGWAEIGRAQAMQAAAAGIEAEAVMNPVLLKPGGAGTSQVVLLGHPVAEAGALDYRELRPRLLAAVLESLADLAARHDVVVCEGAGSPAEINLREGDIVNMGLARAAGLPVIVVGDIDRGGVFAALYGTLALLAPADQEHLAGWVINKFRGDERLLRPGLDMLVSLTGRPVLGVLPWVPGLWLDAEDSLDLAGLALDGVRPSCGEAIGEPLSVAVVALPRLSNVTDLDALAVEPGVDVRLVTRPGELEAADLAVLPGTRSTVADLAWLRARGLDVALHRRAASGRPVLGICGGYQMLAAGIVDDVESRAGVVAGLGLLPARVRFAREKTLGRPQGTAVGQPVEGYEIHHGLVEVVGGEPFLD